MVVTWLRRLLLRLFLWGLCTEDVSGFSSSSSSTTGTSTRFFFRRQCFRSHRHWQPQQHPKRSFPNHAAAVVFAIVVPSRVDSVRPIHRAKSTTLAAAAATTPSTAASGGAAAFGTGGGSDAAVAAAAAAATLTPQATTTGTTHDTNHGIGATTTHSVTVFNMNSFTVHEIETWVYARMQQQTDPSSLDPLLVWTGTTNPTTNENVVTAAAATATATTDCTAAVSCIHKGQDDETAAAAAAADVAAWIRALSERGVSYRAIWDYSRCRIRSLSSSSSSSAAAANLYTEVFRAMLKQRPPLPLPNVRHYRHPTITAVAAAHTENDDDDDNTAMDSNDILYQETCWNVWDEMQRRDVQPTSHTLVALIQAYCRSSFDVQQLRSRLKVPVVASRMPSSHMAWQNKSSSPTTLGVESDTTTLWTDAVYESAIYACVSTLPPPFFGSHTRASQPQLNNVHASDMADELYQTLLTRQRYIGGDRVGRRDSPRSMPSERIYLALFHVYTTTKDTKRGLQLLESILLLSARTTSNSSNGRRAVLTERVWAAALKVFVVAGDDRRTLELLQRMSALGYRPNVRHCTAYLKVLVKQGQLTEAADFLIGMGRHGAVEGSPPQPSRRHLNRDRVGSGTTPQWQSNEAMIRNGAGSSADEDGDNSIFLKVSLPDMVAVKTVLNGCAQRGNFTLARYVLGKAKEGALGSMVQQNLDEQSYNMVLAACNEPILAKELVREMRLSRRHRVGVIAPSMVTLTKAIGVCRKARDVESARFFLKLAHTDRIGVDDTMYSAAIWTAVQANDCRAAVEIYQEMSACNCTPSIVSYNGVIAALSASGHAERAVAVFRDMKHDHPHIYSDYSTFVHLTASIHKVPVEEEQLALLWRVYALLSPRERGINVGGRLLEALIVAYGGLGHFEEAMSVFESIIGPSNAECLRAILFACSFADPPEWETALALLHSSDIVEGVEGPALVEPGALCNAMLACSKANEWQESLQLFRLYGGPNLSIVAANSLIASCGRSGRADMAVRVLSEMKEKGISSDRRSYRNAIMACSQAEHASRRSLERPYSNSEHIDVSTGSDGAQWWEQACLLLGEMKQAGLVPDTPTLSSAISACEVAGRWQHALDVLQCAMDEEAQDPVKDDEQRLNLHCFNAALAACEKGGAWVEAIEIYERMKEQEGVDLRPNVVTMGSLIQALDSAGQKELAITIYEEGIRMNYFKRPWRFTAESASGGLINALDLHSFSAAMSRAAIRSHLESVLSTGLESPSLNKDLTIIVGKGLRSEEFPVLKKAMQLVLKAEFGIVALVDTQNSGRLVIPAETLRLFVAKRSWR